MNTDELEIIIRRLLVHLVKVVSLTDNPLQIRVHRRPFNEMI